MPKVREGLIDLNDIHFDQEKYPREHYRPALAQEYAEAMVNGAEFPPIVLEQGTNDLLDGKHRYEAYKRYAEMHLKHLAEGNGQMDLWPDPVVMVRCEWHTIPEGETPKLYAIGFQQTHGLRATLSEAKEVSREQYQAYPGTPIGVIAERIKQPRRTVQDWLADLIYLATKDLNAVIIRLDCLGWTQTEIAEAVSQHMPQTGGYTQQAIGEILQKMANSPFFVKSDLAHLPIFELIKQSGLAEPLIWALRLQGLSDQERLSEEHLNIKIQPYDVWNFSKADDRFGAAYPGRIPGQLIAHVLHAFTQPGDMVIDAMAGSGTTVDMCLAMGRRCYAYDLKPFADRVDILPHDLAIQGWPERTKRADLIFWDPPYFDKKDDGYPEGSISRLDRSAYLKFFEKAFAEAKALVKRGTRLAFLMSDWNDHDGQRAGIFLWDYADLLRGAGWQLEEHIQVPLSTQQVHPDIVNKFREQGRRARLERYLIISKA